MSVGSPDLLIEAEGAAEAGIEPVGTEIAARSPLELFWRRFRSDRVAMASLGFIVVLILVAVLAPLIVSSSGRPGQTCRTRARSTDSERRPDRAAHHHLFGVDPLGRDMFARVLYGARVSLEVAFVATGDLGARSV